MVRLECEPNGLRQAETKHCHLERLAAHRYNCKGGPLDEGPAGGADPRPCVRSWAPEPLPPVGVCFRGGPETSYGSDVLLRAVRPRRRLCPVRSP